MKNPKLGKDMNQDYKRLATKVIQLTNQMLDLIEQSNSKSVDWLRKRLDILHKNEQFRHIAFKRTKRSKDFSYCFPEPLRDNKFGFRTVLFFIELHRYLLWMSEYFSGTERGRRSKIAMVRPDTYKSVLNIYKSMSEKWEKKLKEISPRFDSLDESVQKERLKDLRKYLPNWELELFQLWRENRIDTPPHEVAERYFAKKFGCGVRTVQRKLRDGRWLFSKLNLFGPKWANWDKKAPKMF